MVIGDEAHDFVVQVINGDKATFSEQLAGKNAYPHFDLIEPGSVLGV